MKCTSKLLIQHRLLALAIFTFHSFVTSAQQFQHKYEISPYDTSYATKIQLVRKPANESKITGIIFDNNKKSLQGITIQIQSNGEPSTVLRSDHNGQFEKIAGPGSYSLQLTSSSHEPINLSVIVSKDSSVNLMIRPGIPQNRFIYKVSAVKKLSKRELAKIKNCLRLYSLPVLCGTAGKYFIEILY